MATAFQGNAFQPNAFQEEGGSSGNNYTITADYGTYAITGQSATILKTRILTAEQGSYSLTGQAATILRSKVVSADYGTYALTGKDAAITYTPGSGNYEITAETGYYALTGVNAQISYSGEAMRQTGGGIGHGGKKRKKQVYIERDGEILLFKNNTDAAAYVAAEKAIEKAQQQARESIYSGQLPVKPPSKPEPYQKIDITALEAFYAAQIDALKAKQMVLSLMARQEFDILMQMQIEMQARMREEDDLEVILLTL